MFLSKFNRAKKIKKLENMIKQDPICSMAGMLMIAAKQPQEMHNKDFAEIFAKAETAFLREEYVETIQANINVKLDTQERKNALIATSVVIAGILEGSISESDMDEIGTVNILKQEALQQNLPWNYVDAYINNFM